MQRLHRVHPERLRRAVVLLCGVTVLLAFLELVPTFAALQVGIAGLSIIVFTPLLICTALTAYVAWFQRSRRLFSVSVLGFSVALVALVIPIAANTLVAKKEGIQLGFSPRTYVSFTGNSIAPARTLTYKVIDGQRLSLALYRSDTETARPTVLLVHGGGWQYGDYLRTNNWPRLFTEAGYQVVSIEYRLASPQTPTWDRAPQDIKDAVAYVTRHAPELGVNPKKLALFGQSAGGHLALLDAYRSHGVQAVIGLYPPTDLEADYKLSVDKGTELAFIGGSPAARSDRYKAVSVPRAATASAPPTLLIQGTNDDIVHFSSSTHLGDRLQSLGVAHKVILLPYTGHSFDNQVDGFATQIAEQAALNFLANTLH